MAHLQVLTDECYRAGMRKAPKSPPLRSPSSGGPALRVSEGESEEDDFVDASEALPAEPAPGATGRTI